MQELRLAVRRLMSRPGPTFACVATLACAIGAVAVTWSLLSATLLRPLPVATPDRWFVVGSRASAGTLRHEFIYPVFPLIHDAGVFEQVIATWTPPESLLVSGAGLPARVAVGFATHDFFRHLGVAIPLGRDFTPQDDRRGAAPVAILMDRYWRQSFVASPSVIGQTITVAGSPVTIVGVAEPGFRGLDLTAAPDLYLPLHTIADVAATSTNYFADPARASSPTAGLRIIGLVRSGEPASHVLARLSTLNTSPGSREQAHLEMTPIGVAALPERARSGMVRFAQLLGMTVALLLLIGCGTVGLLLLVRTESRRAEFATCLALGASVPRLARGIAVEAALLAGAGAVFALPASWWLFAGLRAFQLPGDIDIRFLELAIDRRALLASLAAAAAAFVVIASITGASAFSAAMARSVLAQGATGGRVTRPRTRVTLVTAQVSVALVLLAGATLFVRSLQAALGLNPRVGMHRVLTSEVSLVPNGYTAARATEFFDELRRRVGAHPAVESMAYSVEQGGMGPLGKLTVDGEPRRFPSIVRFTAVDPLYFRTMGIAVASGRDFSDLDTARAPRVTIVSESFARMLASGAGAIGHRVTMPRHSKGQQPEIVTVIGVVPDVVSDLTLLEPLAMYFPLAQHEAGTSRSVTIRAKTDVDVVRREVLTATRELDSTIVLRPFLTLRERIERQMGPQRLASAVLGALGGIALLLTILGTYVLADSMTTLRMHEMGIRAALGATGRQLGTLILTQTARLVGFGLAVGLALAWLGAGTVRAFLFQVQPLDPPTLAGVAALIFTVSLTVALRPALRASRLDVARVLKHE